MSVRRSLLFTIVTFATLLTASPTTTRAGTDDVVARYVDDDGHAGPDQGCAGSDEAFRRIQPAVNASASFDIVWVCPGTYRGRVVIEGDDKYGMNVFGVSGREVILLPPAGSAWNGSSLITVRNVDEVWIKWLRLVAPLDGNCRTVDRMIEVDQGSVNTLIRAVDIAPRGTDTGRCGYRTGIQVAGDSPSWVGSNTITDFREYGIRVTGSELASRTDTTIVNNRVRFENGPRRNGDRQTTGILVESDWSNVVDNRVVGRERQPGTQAARLDQGIHLRANGLVVTGNEVRHAGLGIVGLRSRTFVWGGLFLARNNVSDTTIGIYLKRAVDGLVLNNRVRGSGDGLVVWGPWDRTRIALRIRDNDFRGNRTSCTDSSGGIGTAGLAHRYLRNLGDRSFPRVICTPVG
jgi:parallel beta-helix repeat protein